MVDEIRAPAATVSVPAQVQPLRFIGERGFFIVSIYGFIVIVDNPIAVEISGLDPTILTYRIHGFIKFTGGPSDSGEGTVGCEDSARDGDRFKVSGEG